MGSSSACLSRCFGSRLFLPPAHISAIVLGGTHKTPIMSACPLTAASTSLEYESVSLVVVGGDNGDPAYGALKIIPNGTAMKAQDDLLLPSVLLSGARKFNVLRSEEWGYEILPSRSSQDSESGTRTGARTSTHPLFPPLPVYGPPTTLGRIKNVIFRLTSGILSLSFLSAIVVGSVMNSLPAFASDTLKRIKGGDPDASRPFNKIEKERAKERKAEEAGWEAHRKNPTNADREDIEIGGKGTSNRKLAGGKDKLLCDIGYYARRVGLEVEEFKVETEDGFLIDLQHVFDPDDPPYYPNEGTEGDSGTRRRKYPVLLMHGLLQSAGAFCVNDDDSLAFYLCRRSGLPCGGRFRLKSNYP